MDFDALASGYFRLKASSGSHPPSLSTLRARFPELQVQLDACFLSNPAASALVLERFREDFAEEARLLRVLSEYPAQSESLSEELAESLGVAPKNLFLTNGAAEAIQALLRRFSCRTLVVHPNFTEYHELAARFGVVEAFRLSPENSFRLDPEALLARIRSFRPDTLVLINPNNPDGGVIAQETLRTLLEQIPPRLLVLVDESFIHYTDEAPDAWPSVQGWLKEFPQLGVIKSLAKDYGVAGLRVGYAALSEERVRELRQDGFLWNLNGLAEWFLRLQAQPTFQERYEPLRQQAIRDARRLNRQFQEISGVRAFPSWANFSLIQFPHPGQAEAVMLKLLCEYGVYVRNCSDKPGLEQAECLRWASRTDAENQQGLQALQEVLSAFPKPPPKFP